MSGRPPRSVRRNLVILFADLVGSTGLAERLDPELLRHVLDRYHRACASAIAEHGGVVEKYIGDAVMAVFGFPLSSEEDALRAARAAHAIVARVGELGAALGPALGVDLRVHCGIAAGEAIVVDVPGSDLRVVGDTVVTASRLQSAAGDGEILIGHDAARMIRPWARVAAVPPLSLKGKSAPVRAWRLLSLEPEPRHPEDDQIPLVGRADELGQLRQAYRRVTQGHRCCLVTVLGTPGIGKSRLVREFLRGLPEDVLVLAGRCHSYGAGITYRPIAEMLESLNGHLPAALPALEPSSLHVLRGLGAAPAGAEAGGHEAGVEEISRAVRGLFEALAQRRPLAVVWEDLHWAEPTLLDLIEDLARWLMDVPVLLVCTARPELLDMRRSWGGGISCASALELGPLPRSTMEHLVAELSARMTSPAEVVGHAVDRLSARAVEASDGNPLFAELLLEALAEEGEDASPPPTIQALLGARLDRLDDAERGLLERAATIGQVFTADQLRVLLRDDPDDRPPLDECIRRLVRHRMIRRGATPGSFQFAQTLTRDTVYATARKESRAAWHLALAGHLGERNAGAPGDASFEEPARADLVRHLEAACHLKREVRPDDPLLPALTERAAHALIAQGTQALRRKDLPAAVDLLERGQALLPAGHDAHRPLALRICDAGVARGERDRALAALDAAERGLPDVPRNRLTWAIQRETLALRFGARAPALGRLRELLAADPDDGLNRCRLHHLEALVHVDEGRFGAAEAALREGLRHARSLGDRYEENRMLSGLCELAQWSPAPIEDGLALCAELAARFSGDRALLVPVLITRARLLALAGDVPAARDSLATAGRHADDLHLRLAGVAIAQVTGVVESLAGRHAEAEAAFRRGAAALHASGQTGPAKTLAAYAAREALWQGQAGEAGREADRLGGPGGAADATQLRAELILLALRARVRSAHGDAAGAVALAAEAEERLARTDDPCLRGDVLFEIAVVRHAAGRVAESRDAAERALRHYAVRGANLPAERVRGWLAALGGGTR